MRDREGFFILLRRALRAAPDTDGIAVLACAQSDPPAECPRLGEDSRHWVRRSLRPYTKDRRKGLMAPDFGGGNLNGAPSAEGRCRCPRIRLARKRFTGADFVIRSDGVVGLGPQFARRVCQLVPGR